MTTINVEALFFLIVATILGIFFVRVVSVSFSVIAFIKENHSQYWENNGYRFLIGGRASVFELAKDLDDPELEKFRKEQLRRIKHLLIAVAILSLSSLLVIYFNPIK